MYTHPRPPPRVPRTTEARAVPPGPGCQGAARHVRVGTTGRLGATETGFPNKASPSIPVEAGLGRIRAASGHYSCHYFPWEVPGRTVRPSAR
jgi:hypothetical protein